MTEKMKVFAGNGNKPLAEKICKSLKLKMGEAVIDRFSDGEVKINILDNVRGEDVFVVQSTSAPANENLMELLVLIDALKRASATRITAVLPYFGYARQDRKDRPRVPITAKLVANLLSRAGANRVLTIDLHADQIQGFFDIPLDHLYGFRDLSEAIKKEDIQDLVVVSPDVGGIKRARTFAKILNADLAIVDKRRIDDSKIEVMNIMGEVKGKNALLVDDIVATAGSLIEASQALKTAGAKDIYVAITHAVLAGPAVERLKFSSIKKMFLTDTIHVSDEKIEQLGEKLEIVSVAELFADAFKRIHNEQSISVLFQQK
jgi:ribose-phosphate pyrophosphokinase